MATTLKALREKAVTAGIRADEAVRDVEKAVDALLIFIDANFARLPQEVQNSVYVYRDALKRHETAEMDARDAWSEFDVEQRAQKKRTRRGSEPV